MYHYDETKMVVTCNIKEQLKELIKAVEETPDAGPLSLQSSGASLNSAQQ